MSAQETARMSAFSAAAIVGSDTMKIRAATPEMSCPIIALTRSSTSVCLAILRERAAIVAQGWKASTMALAMAPDAVRFDEAFHPLALANVRAFDRRSAAADGHRPAAVAVVLLPDDAGRACFLLTRRAASLRTHTSQWALPGGRVNPGETAPGPALRELREEVGLGLGEDAGLGLLDDYRSRSGFVITPVVVWAGAAVELQPNPDEVASLLLVPISDLDTSGILPLVRIPLSDRPVFKI